MEYGITLDGFNQMRQVLELLEPKMANRVIKRSLSVGAMETKKIIQKNARAIDKNGDLGKRIARAYQTKTVKLRKKWIYMATAQVNPDKVQPSGLAGVSETGASYYIPNAIEYGHAKPNNSGGMKVTKPIPFARQGFEKAKTSVQPKMIAEMFKKIRKEAQKELDKVRAR